VANCALCGADIDGTVNDSVTLIRLNIDTDRTENLKFCLDRQDGKKVIKGCHNKLLTPAVLRSISDGSRKN
jgi:hypothetical protein